MKVQIPIWFDVEPVDGSAEDMSDRDAENGADQAARDFLVFCEEVTQGRPVEEVEVHAEGFGLVCVKLIGTSD